MAVNLSLLDTLETRVVSEGDKFYARTYSGPTVLQSDELQGFTGGPLPSEVELVFDAQRTAILLGGRPVVASLGDGTTSTARRTGVVLDNVCNTAIVACNASFNTSGQFTLGTALPADVTSVYMYFNAVGVSSSTGGPAVSGWYYCVMSSTTVGQAYAGVADLSGEWYAKPPETLGVVLSTTAGTCIPTLNTHFIAQRIKVPGGSLGASGILRVSDMVVCSSSANNKVSNLRFGGVTICGNAAGAVLAVTKNVRRQGLIYNRDDPKKQLYQGNIFYGPTDGAVATATVDSTVDQYVDVTCGMAAATEWCGVRSLMVEIL